MKRGFGVRIVHAAQTTYSPYWGWVTTYWREEPLPSTVCARWLLVDQYLNRAV